MTAPAAQTTAPGTEVVTVARDGAKTWKYGYIYTTAVYRAVAGQDDGVLTWRRVSSYGADSTAGKKVTGPMVERAKARAAARGCGYVAAVRHGDVCA